MNSIKCQKCGLTNFSSELECRRCGFEFAMPIAKKRVDGKKPRTFSVSTLLMLAGAAGLAYYFFGGVNQSIDEVNANEAKRAASQPVERPLAPSQTRNENDQRRAGHYGDAVRNSQSLNAHEQRTKDTEKMVQQISNGQTR